MLMKDYKIYEGYLDDVELGTAIDLRESITELPHANEAPGTPEEPRTMRIALNEIDSFQTCTCLFSALAENLDRFTAR